MALGRQIEVATREGYTLSLGLLTNTQDEAFRGVQFAWLVNQARGRTGSQISGLGNLALKEVDGWQAAVVGVNWAVGPLQGGQVGLINIAPQVRGWQAAQTTNIVGKIRGWQVAGINNFGGEVKGGQVGLLNVASEVKGWQVGAINLSGHIEGGLPIGLINYSHSGLFNLSTWRDEVGFTMFTLASGSRRSFYTAGVQKRLHGYGTFTDEAARRGNWQRRQLGKLGVGRWRRAEAIWRVDFFLGFFLDGRCSRLPNQPLQDDFDDDYEAHTARLEFWLYRPSQVGESTPRSARIGRCFSA